MKRIIAIIRTEKLNGVKSALESIGCERINIMEVKGRGCQKGVRERYRGSDYCIDLIPKARIELVVKKEDLNNGLNTNEASAKIGDVRHGKIFVSNI